MIAAVLAAAVATVSPLAFDLVCTGVEKTYPHAAGVLDVAVSEQKPFTLRYRVDLQAERWCSGACETSKPIASASSQTIMFESDVTDLSANEAGVSRESGHYVYRQKFGSFVIVGDGECSRAAFTGLPKPLF